MIASSNLSLSGGSVASRKGVATLFLAGVLVAALAAPAASAPPAAPSTTSGNKPAAAAPGKPAPDAASAVPFGTKSKDPIYITSDRLDIYDKEGRAVYSGASGVVATQGASKLVGTELTAYYDRQHDNGDKTAEGQPQQQGAAGTQVKRILVKGPVSVVQNDQVATGDNGEFDRVQNIVTLTGHVSLTQGADVTTGDKLIYDLNTGIANVFSGPGTPVKSLFVQGSQPGETKPAGPQKPPPGKPAPASTSSKAGAKPSGAPASPTRAASAKTKASSPAKAAEP
jgi:lipopolysaccharide export system protein LptA